MPDKEEVQFFGLALSEMVFRMTSFRPPLQVCDEFASRIMAEARQRGCELKNLTVRSTDGSKAH
jgi:hypothetical protein